MSSPPRFQGKPNTDPSADRFARSAELRSGSAAPVVDAVVVGREAVVDAPQHGLGAAGHADLAVGVRM